MAMKKRIAGKARRVKKHYNDKHNERNPLYYQKLSKWIEQDIDELMEEELEDFYEKYDNEKTDDN